MRMLFTAAKLLIAITLLAEVAVASPEVDARLAERLAPETLGRVAVLVDSARRETLPTEPLIQKALEGVTKGADGERIAWAVHSLLDRLRLAREILGPAAPAPELTAAASALYAGVDTTILGQLHDATLRAAADTSSAPTLTVELVVLSDLIARGVPPASASELVLSLTSAGVADATLLEFRRSVEYDIGRGRPPLEAAESWTRGALSRGPAPQAVPSSGPDRKIR
ncbi:MAG: hypothetical protein KAY32_09525 [Candidatus Eisenbacteria sp.]|nr:hypothetical protein [Candidatus Eisenbacteria bacterium]